MIDHSRDATSRGIVTQEDVDAFLRSLEAKGTPWADGCSAVLEMLWHEAKAARSEIQGPKREGIDSSCGPEASRMAEMAYDYPATRKALDEALVRIEELETSAPIDRNAIIDECVKVARDHIARCVRMGDGEKMRTAATIADMIEALKGQAERVPLFQDAKLGRVLNEDGSVTPAQAAASAPSAIQETPSDDGRPLHWQYFDEETQHGEHVDDEVAWERAAARLARELAEMRYIAANPHAISKVREELGPLSLWTDKRLKEEIARHVKAAQSASELMNLLRRVLTVHEQLHNAGKSCLPISLKVEIADILGATDSGSDA